LTIGRRQLLRTTAAATVAGAALGVAAADTPALAQQSPGPAMRPPSPLQAAGITLTAPAPELIALNRLTLGARPGDLTNMMGLGATSDERLAAYVDQQLQPSTIDDSACDAILTAQGFTTLGKTLPQLWQDHVLPDNIDWYERVRPAYETRTATFLRAVYSQRQLVEVLADFWHNHFNVYGFDYWSGPVWVHYDRDVIRANLLGNFRTMLGAVAKSPAMLYYLDNVSNTSAGPNENYARELFELHTLGAENYFGVASVVGPDGQYLHPAPLGPDKVALEYVDEDVYSATQCFTGWRIDPDSGAFYFDESVHEKYTKIVLAQTLQSFSGQAEGERVLDMLANHPGVARFIARKLCRRLISDTPPQSVVDAAANVFHAQRAAPDQLAQVVRTIVLSPEFKSAWGEKIKRPYEYTISLLRATLADFAPDDSFFWMYERMGQPLFQWHPPNGYPDIKEDWSSTMPMLQRWRMCNWLIDGWRYANGDKKDQLHMALETQMPAAIRMPTAIVDFWAERILGYPLPLEERGPIVEFMAHGRNVNFELPAEDIADRLRFMVGLIFMAPSFQWR
jgi:uncharacterized protein (DUF1800 family)